ncbi:MAG: hypothetical protein PHY80_01240 [Rickettsiales bacterium]|nr:hypothetical protein [Rickettsiales bacterium]
MKKDQNNLPDESLEGKIDFVRKDYTLKVLISFFIVFLFVFATTIFFLKKNINTEKFKNGINNEITKIILRNSLAEQGYSTILFNGAVKLKLFPLPHIILNDITGRNILQSNYKLDFNIKQIKLYISLEDILKNKVVIKKSEVIDSEFNVFELQNRENNKIIEKLFEGFLSKNNSVSLISINNSMTINYVYSKMEFTNMNLNTIFTKNKINITGDLKSNKQPLEIDLKFSKNKKGIADLNVNLSSLAFNGNFDLSGNTEKNEFSGKTKFRINDLQLFSRTLFNQSSFLYKRIIDNNGLQLNSSFSLQNSILKISDIVLNGVNINGNGSMIFNFNENQKNEINFNIANINLDGLITKNLGSEKSVNEKEITIFEENSGIRDNIINDRYRTFLEEKLNINPIFFNLKLNNAFLNGNTLKNTELIFYSTSDSGFNFTNVKSELPGDTILLITENDDQDKITINGKNLNQFLSFLRNIKYTETEEDKNNEFSFDGNLNAKNGKIFINNSNFKSKYLNSQNTVEIKFDTGIVFMAIKAQIDDLDLNNFIKENSDKSRLNNILKNKILFLNNFNLNIFANLNIGKIVYKDFEAVNSNLMIKTSQGILGLQNINLNNKIKGNIYFDIMNKQPILNINLKLNDLNFNKNINFSKLIFDLPSLDDFYGNIIISANNLTYKKQPINTLNYNSKIAGGVLDVLNFNIDGFGGKCNISGFLDMQFDRKINLTLNGCTAEIKNVLQSFGNISNIEGLIGFSSILYGEGQNINLFNKSWIFKTQLIGSGIIVKNYGLSKLNSDLFDIQKDEILLKNLKPKEVLFNKDNQTVFESLSGTLQHTMTSGGQFDFDISRPFINGKLVGNFNFSEDSMNVDINANFILLSGTLQHTIPLTILSKIAGKTPDGLNIVTNFQQIDEYIKTTKDSFNKQQNSTNTESSTK